MVAQPIAVRPDGAATQWALDLKHQERNREAWNLPRAVRTSAPGTHRDGLNWAEFRQRYYPDSRRHNFEAIVAYVSPSHRHSLAARGSDGSRSAVTP